MAIEAKGRTHGYGQQLVDHAKSQSQRMPGVAGISATHVASIAWFDSDRVWHALLVDPPRERPRVEFKPSAVLAAHYLPVVRAAAESGVDADGGGRVAFEIPTVDLEINLPQAIFESLDRDDGTWTEATLAAAGDEIIAALERSTESPERFTDTPSSAVHPPDFSYIGGDLVGIKLGPSWANGSRVVDS